MPQDQAFGRRRAASNHMLVAPADIRGHNLQNHAMFTLPVAEGQLGVVNTLHLDHARPHVCQATIARHNSHLLCDQRTLVLV